MEQNIEMAKEQNAKPDLLAYTEDELTAWCKGQGLPAFRGKQLFQWLQQKNVVDFAAMSNLPKSLTATLQQQAVLYLPRLVKEQISKDQSTAKLLLEFADGVLVEVVVMIYERNSSRNRQTICISTQAGCAMGCKFCATALNGLQRNLTAGEMVAQVIMGNLWCKERGLSGISNVVYMGMGEPLANLKAVVKSIRILNEENGMNIGQRRITVSTCGLVPQMLELADQELAIGLAVSLHAPNDALRNQLMPINQKYPISALMNACDVYTAKTGRRISYEYALLKGVNDSKTVAEQLGRLLRGRLAHVNLIPVNFVQETGFLPADREVVKEFADILQENRIEATLREKRGMDIDAACGQLRRKQL